MIRYTEGDLLKADVEALVNTVNTEGFMGKGIALQFKRAFPDNFTAYNKACKQKVVRLGEVFVTEEKFLHSKVKYIVNFPTKGAWRSKSRIADIEAGLNSLKKEIQRLNIRSIAIPPLGCGLGGLSWTKVQPLIEKTFHDMDAVEVLVFTPGHTPKAEEMSNNTKRPKLTSLQAAYFSFVREYMAQSFSDTISLVVAQKLAYFLQISGLPLRLAFVKGRYGPYADSLRQVFKCHEGFYVSGYGDGTQPVLSENIKLTIEQENISELIAEYTNYLSAIEKARPIVSGFESAYAIELLATVHYAAKEISSQHCLEETTKIVQEWTERKKELFTESDIAIAFTHLQECGAL